MPDRALLDRNAVLRVRRLLGRAGPPPATVDEREWRRQRDALLDRFEAGQAVDASAEEVRALVRFLGEAGPSRESRLTRSEWRAAVDVLVPELLATLLP